MDIPTAQLFGTPTIAGLAEAVARMGASPSGQPSIPLAGYTAKQLAAGVPCSLNQVGSRAAAVSGMCCCSMSSQLQLSSVACPDVTACTDITAVAIPPVIYVILPCIVSNHVCQEKKCPTHLRGGIWG